MSELILKCKDLGFDCDFEARSQYVDDIIYKMGEHLYVKHHVTDLNPELKDKIKWNLKVKII